MTESEPISPPGRVVLVGAGPGGPGLLTVAAIDALRHADIVFYDRLAGPAFRRYVRPTTELVDVGKRPGRLDVDQSTIQERLIVAARAGRQVVRVKGGSPFVFGRGYEEVLACRAAGLDVAVVPGLSSSIAAPTAAGVPLTHRGLAPAFVVVSGHEDPAKGPASVDWAALAALGVPLVILMGVGTIATIADTLVRNGRRPETPVVAIEAATLPGQRVVHATLGAAAATFAAAGVMSPAVIVVGEVAALGADIGLDNLLSDAVAGVPRGLSGWRILVPRRRHGDSALGALLAAEGAVVEEVRLSRVVVGPDRTAGAAFVAALADGSVGLVAVASRLRLDGITGVLAAHGLDWRALAGVRIWATTPDAQTGLRGIGLRPDVGPDDAVPPCEPDSSLAYVAGLAGADEPALTRLAGAGWDARRVDVVEFADADRNALDDARRSATTADAVVFASSGTVRAWAQAGLTLPPVVACVGPATAQAAAAAGIDVDVVPGDPHLPALVAALVAYAMARADDS